MPRDRATETAELVSPEFDRLFVETGADLWRAVYVYTRSRDLAEEVVSEAFTRYVERSGSVRNPRAWLYRVALRLASEELKRRRRRATPQPGAEAPPPEELVAVLDALGAFRRSNARRSSCTTGSTYRSGRSRTFSTSPWPPRRCTFTGDGT